MELESCFFSVQFWGVEVKLEKEGILKNKLTCQKGLQLQHNKLTDSGDGEKSECFMKARNAKLLQF